MPTDMNAAMRAKRRALDQYTYQPPKASAISESDSDADTSIPADTADTAPDSETPPTITVLGPQDASDPDMYTYEKMDNGAWMVYPPGVPCEKGKSRVQLDHPATEAEYADMDAALETSGETTEKPEEASAEQAVGSY